MKQIIILFNLIIFIIINNCYGQTLEPNQFQAISNILSTIYQGTNIQDPCGWDTDKLICLPIQGDPNGYYYVQTINFYDVPTKKVLIINDLTVFTGLNSLNLAENITIISDFFNNMKNIPNLYVVTIHTHESPISANAEFPLQLTQIEITYFSSNVVDAFFLKGVASLKIKNAGPNYAITATTFNETSKLNYLVLPITPLGKFPSNSNLLTGLLQLTLVISNSQDIVSYEFPLLGPFIKLTTLTINLLNSGDGSIYKKWTFPDSLTKVGSTVSSLTITGYGLILNSSIGYTDFTGLGSNLILDVSNAQFIEGCTSTPCIKLPPLTILITRSTSYDLSILDFTNVVQFQTWNNLYVQELLVYPTLQLNPSLMFMIKDSSFRGNIPNDYCALEFSNFQIKGCQFDGEVAAPTCYVCIGYSNSWPITPLNNYPNLPTNALPSCPTFIANVDKSIVKTDGSSIITISGVDLGWGWSSDESTPAAFVIIPNFKYSIPIGFGVGKDITKDYKINLNSNHYYLNYSYEAPVINSFKYNSEAETIVIYGSGFAFIENSNYLKINNGNSLQLADPATKYDENYNQIVITLELTGQSKVLGSSFQVNLTVGGQIATASFILYTDIQIKEPTNKLQLQGGIGTLIGNFTTSTPDLLKLLIEGDKCEIISVSSNELKFNYPSNAVGMYESSIIFGPNTYNFNLNYAETNTPSPTTTSPTTTSPTTTSTTSSEDSNQPSSSSLVSINVFLSLFVLILLLNI